MNRKILIAANWKQNGTSKSLSKLTFNIIANLKHKKNRGEIVLFPPSIYIDTIKKILEKKNKHNIFCGIQNISEYESGAYTGEISIQMAKDLKCKYCIIGHSERRIIFKEQQSSLTNKIMTSLRGQIKTIYCIGETLSEYNKKFTKRIISHQLQQGLKKSLKFIKTDPGKLIVAYEPVWAIGTGKNASESDIINVHKHIRKVLFSMFGKDSDKIRIIYGGSVNSKNANTILNINEVDGVLVGGASLNSKKFVEICSSI
tara:strand:- start:104 stop:877 length:774 start_codon:yes stop_codon:yes gene_type:complete